ncbi:HAD-IA family hydrolase [Candidatus Woesearchaeota archaeon]|nr:HAD-IA family hydrolase [Candidatus Woesearchaeota archaeon]
MKHMKPLSYSFRAFGHPNLLVTHRNTLEFTKDANLSKKGDCIIGVRADFNYRRVQKLCQTYKTLRVQLQCGSHHDSFTCKSNNAFCSHHELVFRISNFLSERTVGTYATKAAKDINRSIVRQLQDPTKSTTVTVEPAFKAVIFDFDDTIEDFQSAKEATHLNLAKHLAKAHQIPEREAKEELDLLDVKYSKLAKGKTPGYFSRHLWFIELFNHFAVSASEEELRALVDLYWKHVNQSVRMMSGAKELLAKLRKKCFVILMTDSDGAKAIKTRRLQHLGVHHLFDFIITSDDTGCNKPHQSFYERIGNRFGIMPDECIMVGDKPQVDLELAKKLGLLTVWVQHGDWSDREAGKHFSYADHEVSTISELKRVLEELL